MPPFGTERPLSPREQQFAEAVARGLTLKEAGKSASIGYRTAKRWAKSGRIQASIERRTSENFAAARAILTAASSQAARNLADIADAGTPDASRVAACRAILVFATEMSELQSLRERISALESTEGDQS
jgi:hypothetical protein